MIANVINYYYIVNILSIACNLQKKQTQIYYFSTRNLQTYLIWNVVANICYRVKLNMFILVMAMVHFTAHEYSIKSHITDTASVHFRVYTHARLTLPCSLLSYTMWDYPTFYCPTGHFRSRVDQVVSDVIKWGTKNDTLLSFWKVRRVGIWGTPIVTFMSIGTP